MRRLVVVGLVAAGFCAGVVVLPGHGGRWVARGLGARHRDTEGRPLLMALPAYRP